MSPRRTADQGRVLVTGAAGAAAVSVIRSLGREPARILAADEDAYAPGLYLVPPEDRALVPAAHDPTFAEELLAVCRSRRVTALIPTRTAELLPIAAHSDEFAAAGIRVMLASREALRVTLDRQSTRRRLSAAVPIVDSQVLDGELDPATVTFPAILAPRGLTDPREPVRVPDAEALDDFPRDGTLLVESESAMGPSVDVLRIDGRIIAAVPRESLRREGGVPVTARTRRDPALADVASTAVSRLEIEGVGTARFRRDGAGKPRVAEVVPSVPASIALTAAAGVNMPALWLRSVVGRGGVSPVRDFDEIAIARTPLDQILPVAELAALGEADVPGAGPEMVGDVAA